MIPQVRGEGRFSEWKRYKASALAGKHDIQDIYIHIYTYIYRTYTYTTYRTGPSCTRRISACGAGTDVSSLD
jgi:hypothetical protein